MTAHVLDLEAAAAEAIFDADALALAHAFWPGPLTLVAPVSARTRISQLARAGLQSVALRTPSHGVARALIAADARQHFAACSRRRSGDGNCGYRSMNSSLCTMNSGYAPAPNS